MTLNEIAYSIKNRLEGFVPSDDSLLDIEYIYDMVKKARAELLVKLDKKKMRIDDYFYQKICCLEIVCEKTICDEVEVSRQYKVEIPNISPIASGVQYLGSPDMSYGFQYTSVTGFINNFASQFSSKRTYYTFIENFAYIKNLPTPDMKYICLVGILEDPLNGKCASITANDEFPIPLSYIPEIEEMVIRQLMPTMVMMPDNANDATPDIRSNRLNYIQPQRRKR